jgi:hypothetical protein
VHESSFSYCKKDIVYYCMVSGKAWLVGKRPHDEMALGAVCDYVSDSGAFQGRSMNITLRCLLGSFSYCMAMHAGQGFGPDLLALGS